MISERADGHRGGIVCADRKSKTVGFGNRAEKKVVSFRKRDIVRGQLAFQMLG